MAKLIILLMISGQFLFSSFLQIDQTQMKTIKNMFGTKALKRVEYIQNEFEKIAEEEFTYTKIYMVNSLINRLIYKKDKVHWQNDRNSTLLEFITSGAGDSLDFASAKYVVLTKLGLDKNRFHFFKTDIDGISKHKFDTKNYYVLAYTPKNATQSVLLDCYTDKIIPSFRKKVPLKPSGISFQTKKEMLENNLKINFIQQHQFLKVDRKRL